MRMGLGLGFGRHAAGGGGGGTAPVITGTPLLTDNAIDVSGTLPMTFGYTSTASATPPSAATIKAAPDSRSLVSGANVLTGLTQETTPGTWYFHYMVWNSVGDSAIQTESYVVAAPGLTYVGGKVAAIPASSGTDTTVSLTDLTGGSGSAPAAGDIVLVGYAIGTSGVADTNVALVTSGYTEVADLYSDDLIEANLAAFWKVMGGSPDTSVVASPTGSALRPGEMTIQVWRGINATPMDVTATTATGLDTGRPSPPAITPTTSGAVVVVFGAAAHVDNATLFTSSDLANFLTENTQGTSLDVTIGMGSFAWSSGTFTPASWTGPTVNTSDSWAAISIALRPA